MQKLEKKSLEEKLEELDSSLSAHPCLVHNPGLARRRATKKPKGTLSVKTQVKREVNMKSKIP